MTRIENNCVSCDIPCVDCGRKHQEVLCCDHCGVALFSVYFDFGIDEILCEDCADEQASLIAEEIKNDARRVL